MSARRDSLAKCVFRKSQGARSSMRGSRRSFIVSFLVLVSAGSRNYRSSSPSLQGGVADDVYCRRQCIAPNRSASGLAISCPNTRFLPCTPQSPEHDQGTNPTGRRATHPSRILDTISRRSRLGLSRRRFRAWTIMFWRSSSKRCMVSNAVAVRAAIWGFTGSSLASQSAISS